MNRIDFSKLGGYPLTQADLDFIQSSYTNVLSGIAKLCGDKVIVSGMVVTGGNVSAGMVSINGEFIPFAAGAIGAGGIIIQQTTTSKIFKDGVSKVVRYDRVARFGSPATYLYSDFKRLDFSYLLPKGGVIMWSGIIADIPAGWALCDGANGTPDLSGIFIVGYDAADADYNAVGKTGGSKTATILKTNLPHIQIEVPIPANKTSQSQEGVGRIATGSDDPEPSDATSLFTDFLGDGTPIGIRPKYYTLAYIIKQ